MTPICGLTDHFPGIIGSTDPGCGRKTAHLGNLGSSDVTAEGTYWCAHEVQFEESGRLRRVGCGRLRCECLVGFRLALTQW
jgi:hypothetical protein